VARSIPVEVPGNAAKDVAAPDHHADFNTQSRDGPDLGDDAGQGVPIDAIGIIAIRASPESLSSMRL